MRRIALVEDNEDNRLLVQAILGDEFEVVEYPDGHSAVQGIPENIPDLVLLDISLPGLDGVDVLRRLREHPALAQIPAIALTAHAMAGDRERFAEAGFDGYVTKPILDEDELISSIRSLLDRVG